MGGASYAKAQKIRGKTEQVAEECEREIRENGAGHARYLPLCRIDRPADRTTGMDLKMYFFGRGA